MRVHFPFGKPPEGIDVLWRCEARRYSIVIDAEREEYGVSNPRLEVRFFFVVQRTPKGAWIRKDYSFSRSKLVELDRTKHQLVILSHIKAYARNTVEEAVADFAARRCRQIKILEGQLQRARYELALTESNPMGALLPS